MQVEDHVLTAPCATEVLFPASGGNIHAFTAVTACAVLDVLAPPYDADRGRSCTYYRMVSACEGGEERGGRGEGGGGGGEQTVS